MNKYCHPRQVEDARKRFEIEAAGQHELPLEGQFKGARRSDMPQFSFLEDC